MKKIRIIGLVFLALSLSGCQDCKKEFRHMHSSFTGLNRRVTLYAVDGSVIRTWEGQFMVENDGPVASFIDDDNNEIKIAGTFVIEEID